MQSSGIKTIFLDANVLWKARQHRRLFVTERQTLTWGPHEVAGDVAFTDNVIVFEKNAKQLGETLLLERIAKLAKSGSAQLITHDDAVLASRLRARGAPYCAGGEFFGANVDRVSCSIPYTRSFGQGFDGTLQVQGFQNRRFLALCKVTGAVQGGKLKSRKQLPDAFLLCCAEENDATHFVTLDKPLIDKAASARNGSALKVVWPSGLLGEYWRYRLWPWMMRLIEKHPEQLLKRLQRRINHDNILVKEDDKTWWVAGRPDAFLKDARMPPVVSRHICPK